MATRKRHKKKATTETVVEEAVKKETIKEEKKEEVKAKPEREIVELPPKKKYTQEEIDKATKYAQRETFKDILPYIIIIVCVIFIRTFIVTPVDVSGESMMPTLHNGDIMLLYKLRLKTVGINRFDVVVINTDSGKLIKRVIGLPGDKIEYKIEDGKTYLYINEEEVKEEFSVKENLLQTCRFNSDICNGIVEVPEDEYYVMGDNRGNSKDSRMIGTIKKKDIAGITSVILYPFNRFGSINK